MTTALRIIAMLLQQAHTVDTLHHMTGVSHRQIRRIIKQAEIAGFRVDVIGHYSTSGAGKPWPVYKIGA
jgi:predicted ABC-type ATPase